MDVLEEKSGSFQSLTTTHAFFLFTNVLRVLSYVEDNFQVMRPLITDNYHTS